MTTWHISSISDFYKYFKALKELDLMEVPVIIIHLSLLFHKTQSKNIKALKFTKPFEVTNVGI